MPPASPASGTVQTSRQCSCTTSAAVVYAPIAINAPWPSEICPVYPVTRFSPMIAMKKTPACARSREWKSLTYLGAKA